jgi:TolB-like protein
MLAVMPIRQAEAGKPPKSEDAPPVAAPTLDAQLDDLARQVLESLRVERKSKIAVAEFPDLNGEVTEFGQFVAEELITRLYRSGSFQVVERRLLNKVITEQELSLSGLVDTGSAQRLGQILGVDAIATGSITDLGDVLKLNARLISTETGTIFAVAAVELVKDRNVARLLNRRMQDGGKPVAVAVASGGGRDATGTVPGSPPGEPGLWAEYYNLTANNLDVPAGNPVFQRVDPTISFNWGGLSPVPRVNANWFGVRWTGFINIEQTGTYTFSIVHDDGLRLWVGGRLIHDHQAWSRRAPCRFDVTFDQAGWLPFRAEFFDALQGANVDFRWARPGAANFEAPSPTQFRHLPR